MHLLEPFNFSKISNMQPSGYSKIPKSSLKGGCGLCCRPSENLTIKCFSVASFILDEMLRVEEMKASHG